MRAYNKTGPLSVQAIAGAYVVLLGIDMEEAPSEGVLGFGIERIEHGHGHSRTWLQALKVFPDLPRPLRRAPRVLKRPAGGREPIPGFPRAASSRAAPYVHRHRGSR